MGEEEVELAAAERAIVVDVHVFKEIYDQLAAQNHSRQQRALVVVLARERCAHLS